MQRITKAVLASKVSRVNAALGYGASPEYPTIGAVVLYSAYGSTAVHRVVNSGGGQDVLSPLGTKRECAIFLDGMLSGFSVLPVAR